MSDRTEWLSILDVALDALKEREYARAWELYAELDKMHPTWLFEIRRAPLRSDTGKPETRSKQVLAWMMRDCEMRYREIADVFGCSTTRAAELARGGYNRIAFATKPGDLEDDFAPAEHRREKRRRAIANGEPLPGAWSAGAVPRHPVPVRRRQCPCEGADYCTDPSCDY